MSTHAENRADYIQKLGSDLGTVLHELLDEYWALQLRWGQYRVLFAASEKRIDLLNEAGGLFFRVVQDELFANTLLCLCRLTDNRTVSGRDTLSLNALPWLCRPIAEVDQATLNTLIAKAQASTAFARDWRHRTIAHSDLALATGNAKPLASASRALIGESIAAVFSVLDYVHGQCLRLSLWADGPIAQGPDASSLLYVIRDGLKVRDERNARIKNGTFTEADWSQDPID